MKCHIVLGVVSLFGLSLILLACGSGASIPAPVAIAYVAHPGSHSMSVVNIPTNKTVSTIEIGNSSSDSLTTTASYPTDVAVTPDGSRAYVTDGNTSVWVVDTKSNNVIGKIPSGTIPERIAITPDGKRAYVTTITCGLLLCSGPGNPAEFASVNVIDLGILGTGSLVSTITLAQAPATLLTGLTISPDGTHVYATGNVGNSIWVIDTATNSIIGTISTAASGFNDVSASPNGTTVYAIGWATTSAFVDVIDTQTDTVTTSITLPNIETPTRIAVTPDGGHAYLIGEEGLVWVIDTMKNVVVATIPVASAADELQGIAFTPDGTHAYVTCIATNLIYVLDTSTYRVVDTIQNYDPAGLAISRAM